MGESTEHTAFLRLKDGIQAPRSGSREPNGRIVSEQIGAEIFADGWALVSPGDPELAARLAGEAARVSHDGEAVYAAQVIAAMEAAAFTESDMSRLIDSALRLIPADSTIKRVTDEVREWCARDTEWRTTRALIEEKHGYARYGGHVPVVSNFAVVRRFSIDVRGDRITARIDEKVVFDVVDDNEPLDAGGIALVCTQGSLSANAVRVEPLESR